MKGDTLTEESPYKEQALVAARAIDEKKGTDIVIQDVSNLLNVTDYFVICTAANNRRVDAIAEEVEERLTKEFGVKPVSIEGLDESEWVLMDYGPYVVHIFQPGPRDYYRLEQLWAEAPTIDVALAGIEDPVYTERIANLLERAKRAEEKEADEG